jgi:hypothetical protein
MFGAWVSTPTIKRNFELPAYRQANDEAEISGYLDIRLSGSGYQNIRVSGFMIFWSVTFPDILMPGILPPDSLVP